MGDIDRISHIVLAVSDLARSEAFYGELLGFRPLGRNLWSEEGDNSTFVLPSDQLVILCQLEAVQEDGPGVHTNFMVGHEDYQAAYDRLKAVGAVEGDHREENRSVGTQSTYFNDPDGHSLQITAVSPEAYAIPAAQKGKIKVGRPDVFPVGSVTRMAEGSFYLVRLGDGFLAVSDTCTHMQCKVRYQKEHWRFYCPCHYSTFSWTGAHTGHLDNVAPLPLYPISLEDGELVVDTDRLGLRREHSTSDFFRA